MRSRFCASAKKANTCSRASGRVIVAVKMWDSGDIGVYDQVHDPAGAGGACAGAGAFASVQKGVNDGLYQGLLHVFWGGIIKGLGPSGRR